MVEQNLFPNVSFHTLIMFLKGKWTLNQDIPERNGRLLIGIYLFKHLTFLATKRTMSRAPAKHPAAILAVRRFVEARMRTIPQNDEPRSGRNKAITRTHKKSFERRSR